ncbi:hypothetical protein D3C73_1132680 [compost metagenome]
MALPGPGGVAAPFSEKLQHLLFAEAGDVAQRPGVSGIRALACRLDVVVDIAVRFSFGAGNAIGHAVCNELLDGGNDVRDGLHRTDVMVRSEDIQSVHVCLEQVNLALRQFAPVHASGRGPLQKRIIDVRDVLDVGHPDAGIAPGTVQEVESHVTGCVSHVGGVIRRDAADIHRLFRLSLDVHHTTKGCVVQP